MTAHRRETRLRARREVARDLPLDLLDEPQLVAERDELAEGHEVPLRVRGHQATVGRVQQVLVHGPAVGRVGDRVGEHGRMEPRRGRDEILGEIRIAAGIVVEARLGEDHEVVAARQTLREPEVAARQVPRLLLGARQIAVQVVALQDRDAQVAARGRVQRERGGERAHDEHRSERGGRNAVAILRAARAALRARGDRRATRSPRRRRTTRGVTRPERRATGPARRRASRSRPHPTRSPPSGQRATSPSASTQIAAVSSGWERPPRAKRATVAPAAAQ